MSLDDAIRDQKTVMIDYTNWRGERSTRAIIPLSIFFGANQWHTEPQWLMDAADVKKKACRTFALSGIHGIKTVGGRSAVGPITIDGVAVEPIRLTTSDRGFRHAEFRDGFNGTGFLGESSRDGEPGIWLGVRPDLLWLSRAHVAALLPHLQRFVERGDLGGEDAETMPGTPAPEPPPARIGDISSIGAKKARLRAERIAAERAAEGDGLSVIDDETA